MQTEPVDTVDTAEHANPMANMTDEQIAEVRAALDAETASRKPAEVPVDTTPASDFWRVAMMPDSSQRLVYVGPDTTGGDGPDWTATHALPAGARVLDATAAP